MENGALTESSTSSHAEPVCNITLNGVNHVDENGFREKLLCDKKKALLEERQRILDGEDEVMLDEVRAINEQMQEQKQMLISRMERQFHWITERCREDLEKLNEEEKSEVIALTELMYNQLDKLKEGVEEKINRIDLFDKRSLAFMRIPDKKLNLEPAMPDEEENGCESPTNAVLEKRYTLPGRLINDIDIKDDLVHLNQSITPTDFDFHEVARSIRPKHKVIMDRSRFIYDGKTFYRGQKLFVQTTNYTRFPAIVYALTDEYVHIKSRTPGDIREVYATIDDLRLGRVRIGRKALGDASDPLDPQSP